MRNVPVAMLTYNRTNLLKNALAEHERVNTPSPIYIFDDGSTDNDKLALLNELDKDERFIVVRFEHKGYKNQFLAIMKYFKELEVDYYAFVEDDAVFSINWYTWGTGRLRQLESAAYNVGVFTLYTGHPHLRELVLASVFKHNTEHFYGTCCLFINPKIMDEYIYQAYDEGWNPDVAIREMSLKRSKFLLFVSSPTLAQHIGTESLLGAPPHRSSRFLGQSVDALKEL